MYIITRKRAKKSVSSKHPKRGLKGCARAFFGDAGLGELYRIEDKARGKFDRLAELFAVKKLPEQDRGEKLARAGV